MPNDDEAKPIPKGAALGTPIPKGATLGEPSPAASGTPPQTMVGRLADSIFGAPKPHSLVDMARGGSAPTLRDLGTQAVDTAKEFWRGLGDPVNLGMGAAFGGTPRSPQIPKIAPLALGGEGLAPETGIGKSAAPFERDATKLNVPFAGEEMPEAAPSEFTPFKDFPLQTQLGLRRAARLAVTPPKPGPVQGPEVMPAPVPFSENVSSSATPKWAGQLPPISAEPSVSIPTVQPKANLTPQPNPQWFPEPRTETPIDRPGSMWSVGRETLPGRAQRGQPGALDVLTNVSDRPPLVTPRPTLGVSDPSFTDLRARYGLAVSPEPTEAGVPQGNATPFAVKPGYMPAQKVTEMSEAPRNYGPEFNSQQWQEEINRNNEILRNPAATAEDRAIAADRLRDAQEGMNRVLTSQKARR